MTPKTSWPPYADENDPAGWNWPDEVDEDAAPTLGPLPDWRDTIGNRPTVAGCAAASDPDGAEHDAQSLDEEWIRKGG